MTSQPYTKRLISCRSVSESSFDVVVVGLGAMGAATAWQLASRGVRVAGFDRHHPPHTFGSTHGHSRIIREAYFEHPQYVPLVQAAYGLWAQLEACAKTRLFQASGGVTIGRPGSALLDGSRRSAREHGLVVQEWTAPELADRIPALATVPDMIGLFEPRAGLLAPERGVQAMLDVAAASGAALWFDEPVQQWAADAGGVTVTSATRTVRADRVVLAAGPWLPELIVPGLAPFSVERVVQYWYPSAPDDRFAPARLPVFLLETPDGRVLYGLPDQGQGLKLAEHHGGTSADMQTLARSVSADERARFHAFAGPWMRGLESGPRDATVCVYTNTPDGDFVLDPHPHAPRVFLLSACSGHGFKFAPAIGELVARELCGEPPQIDLTPFRLARFTHRHGSHS
jgi:sarcosine oxidase